MKQVWQTDDGKTFLQKHDADTHARVLRLRQWYKDNIQGKKRTPEQAVDCLLGTWTIFEKIPTSEVGQVKA